MIPAFPSDGNLPAGIHWAGWDQIVERFGGTPRRALLLDGLRQAVDALERAACSTVYLDGSFVTSKAHPGDFDVCWEVAGVDPNLLDPIFFTFDEGRRSQKERYGGEFFPAEAAADPHGTVFLDFFQTDRTTNRRKGIVAIALGSGHDQE
jgi:hypothetical protein